MAAPELKAAPEVAFLHTIQHLRLGEFDIGGVLYHAHYFHLFEMAREALLRSGGTPYPELVNDDCHLAVTESQQRFHSPILYGDIIQISVWVSELKRVSVTFNYLLQTENKAKVHHTTHSAWTKHAFVTKNSDNTFTAAPIPGSLRATLEKYKISI